MSARPGGVWWLLRHELRLACYNSAFVGKRTDKPRKTNKRAIGAWLAVWALLHLGAYAMLSELDLLAQAPTGKLLVGVTVAICAMFMLMLSAGLKSSVEALFERGDLDLLLSSPLPSRSIFAVRLAGIVISVAVGFLYFLAPLANAGLMLGDFRWLGVYAVVIGCAAVAAAAAMLLTLGLVRMLGARRTRVVAQVVGAIAGAFLFLLSQVSTWLRDDSKAAFARWLGHALASDQLSGQLGVLWLPARAVLGAPEPMLAIAVVAGAVLVLTVHFTHRFFVHGLQQAASTSRVAKRPAAAMRFQFNRNLWLLTLLKEWKLIGRDAHLVSEVLLQLLYLLPMCFVLLSKKAAGLPGIAIAMTLLCGSLTASLGWLTVLAEEAPDLLLSSPANARMLRLAKISAAAIPPLAIVAIPLLWAIAHDPVVGAIAAFTVAGAIISNAITVQWSGRPAKRGEFKMRAKNNGMAHWLATAGMLAWSGLSYVLFRIHAQHELQLPTTIGVAALSVTVLALPLIAFAFRHRAD